MNSGAVILVCAYFSLSIELQTVLLSPMSVVLWLSVISVGMQSCLSWSCLLFRNECGDIICKHLHVTVEINNGSVCLNLYIGKIFDFNC